MKKGGRNQHLSTSSLSLVTLVASVLAGCSASAEGRIDERENACHVSSAIEGTYESPGAKFEASAGKCVDLAGDLQRAADDFEFTLERIDNDTFETRGHRAAPRTYRLDGDRCELVRTTTQALVTTDLDGRPATAALASVVTVRASGPRLVAEQTIEVTSATPGAKGFPCTITARNTATRRP